MFGGLPSLCACFFVCMRRPAGDAAGPANHPPRSPPVTPAQLGQVVDLTWTLFFFLVHSIPPCYSDASLSLSSLSLPPHELILTFTTILPPPACSSPRVSPIHGSESPAHDSQRDLGSGSSTITTTLLGQLAPPLSTNKEPTRRHLQGRQIDAPAGPGPTRL